MDLTLWASLFAGISVIATIFLIIDFINDISIRYKERFLREASTELDDVLSELPPEKILNISFALSGIAAILCLAYLAVTTPEAQVNAVTGEVVGGWSWLKAVFFCVTAAIIAFPSPRLYLRWRRQQRLIKFNEQLVDALGSISSALKAGFSINQAIEVVAEERIKPISDEFSILVREMRLGVPLEESLQKMNQRISSDDFELVSAAIITARQTGGELTVVLERLAAMIRERLRINGRIRALTAQGRLQAYVIGAMPYLLLVGMAYAAPQLTSRFYNGPLGLGIIVLVTIFVLIGFFTIKKITTIDI